MGVKTTDVYHMNPQDAGPAVPRASAGGGGGAIYCKRSLTEVSCGFTETEATINLTMPADGRLAIVATTTGVIAGLSIDGVAVHFTPSASFASAKNVSAGDHVIVLTASTGFGSLTADLLVITGSVPPEEPDDCLPAVEGG